MHKAFLILYNISATPVEYLPNGTIKGVERLNVTTIVKMTRFHAYWIPYMKSYWEAYIEREH